MFFSSVFEENLSKLSKMAPRYLYSTSSTGFPWMEVMDAVASCLLLVEKVTTISLVLLRFSSRCE